jgi:hypothetical protein
VRREKGDVSIRLCRLQLARKEKWEERARENNNNEEEARAVSRFGSDRQRIGKNEIKEVDSRRETRALSSHCSIFLAFSLSLSFFTKSADGALLTSVR